MNIRDTQRKNQLKLASFIIGNPDREVVCMVGEDVHSGEHSYMCADIGDSRLDSYFMWSDRMYFTEDDLDEDRKDAKYCDKEDEFADMNEDDIDKALQEDWFEWREHNLKWKDCIVVYIEN